MSFSHWTIATRINSKRRDKRSAFHNFKKRFDLKNITAYQKTSNVTKVPLEAIRTKIKKEQKKIFLLRLFVVFIITAVGVYTAIKLIN
jgi:hypothetical protein